MVLIQKFVFASFVLSSSYADDLYTLQFQLKLLFAMNWFKKMFYRQPEPQLKQDPGQEEMTLIGRVAQAVTPLRTNGFIELDGQRYEVMSSKGYVAAGTYVRITGKRMGWFRVEPVEESQRS